MSTENDSGDSETRMIAGPKSSVDKGPEKIGEYTVLGPIGQGGMGMVVLGHDPHLDRKVAIKFVRQELAAEKTFVDRFLREARLSARLSHPNIVSVYQVGRHLGAPYLVMEYIDGMSFRQLLRTPPPLTVGAVVGYAQQCCEGLAAAAAAGIIHRDIKPANLMVRRDGVLKIMDFGLSKSVRGDSNTITNAVLGTPEYMSPEQSQGLPTDSRTDMYALGITIFQGVTGYLPFSADDAVRIMLRHQTEPLPEDAKLMSIADGRLWLLVRWMTEKDPAHRPTSWGEIRNELKIIADLLAADPGQPQTRLALQNIPSPPPSAGARIGSAPSPAITTPGRGNPPSARPSGRVRRLRRSALIIGGGLAAIGLLSIGALALTGGINVQTLLNRRPAAAATPPVATAPPVPAVPTPAPPSDDGISISSRSGATWSDLAAGLQASGVSLVFEDIDPARELAAFHLQGADPEKALRALCLAAGWDESSAEGIHRLRRSQRQRCAAVAESNALVNRAKLPNVTVDAASAERTLGDVAEAIRLTGGVSYLIADQRLADFPVKKFALVDKPLSAVMKLAQESGAPMEWTFEDGILVMVPCTRAK